MTDTTDRPAWLTRLVGLMDGSLKTDIDPHDIVTGAQWRDFYCNNWPREFYIDDFRVDVEDECGEYILPDDSRHPFEAFGMGVWQERDDFGPLSSGTMVDVHLLYAAVMDNTTKSVVSFRVDTDNLEALIAAAKAVGAEKV